MIKRIDTIILLVTDIDISVGFYRDNLGIPLKFKSPGWAEFVLGDVHLALHRKSRNLTDKDMPFGTIGVSVNFEVDHSERLVSRLETAGIEPIGGVKEYDFGKSFFVTDPDGYIIGFREYKLEFSPHPVG